MTIEVALIISFVSVAFGLWSGIVNIKRNTRNDTKSEASELTTVIIKLENIGNDIKDSQGSVAGHMVSLELESPTNRLGSFLCRKN